MLEIDGNYGEGGGQILRTALSLSCLLNLQFHLFNIRKGRKMPGLMPQHLTCVRSMMQISRARVEGDFIGSQDLIFSPSEIRAGNYFFDIGTAGSTSLLLQCILPPLIFAKNESVVTVKGGTHVPFSPTFNYIRDVFIPMLRKLGITLTSVINRYGFYPKGGGEIIIKITPSEEIHGLTLQERGGLKAIQGISGVANLPESIAQRQREAAIKTLAVHGLKAEIEMLSVPAFGHGTFIFIKSETDICISGFSSLGQRGKKAELVGEEAAGELITYHKSSACIEHHLADQIILYLAVAKGISSFSTSCITNHLLTNLWVIEKFTGIRFTVTGQKGFPGKVTLSGKGLSF
ncbi:MAG: RNA 3'-terminal phosphate cyclase [Nitrospirota bacterium]